MNSRNLSVCLTFGGYRGSTETALLKVPARINKNDMNALRYFIVTFCTKATAVAPDIMPKMFFVVGGTQPHIRVLNLTSLSLDASERQTEVFTIGRILRSQNWAADTSAVFFSGSARLKDASTGEVIKQIVTTTGVRRDRTDCVYQMQDITHDTRGNIVLAPSAPIPDMAGGTLKSYFLYALLDGLLAQEPREGVA
jgi:hypothetical protein